jgi:Co/Zn/Cd efflux system component
MFRARAADARPTPSRFALPSGTLDGVDSCSEVRPVPAQQRRVLQIVLWINAAMFLAEFGAGLAAHSTALLADSVDMLGDAILYGFSISVVVRGAIWQARAALLKGAIMAVFGAGVLAEVGLKSAWD